MSNFIRLDWIDLSAQKQEEITSLVRGRVIDLCTMENLESEARDFGMSVEELIDEKVADEINKHWPKEVEI